MDVAINCVLMPCAHEVACLRCASRLGTCPICRTAVCSTLRVFSAATADRERAARALRESRERESRESRVTYSGALPPPENASIRSSASAIAPAPDPSAPDDALAAAAPPAGGGAPAAALATTEPQEMSDPVADGDGDGVAGIAAAGAGREGAAREGAPSAAAKPQTTSGAPLPAMLCLRCAMRPPNCVPAPRPNRGLGLRPTAHRARGRTEDPPCPYV